MSLQQQWANNKPRLHSETAKALHLLSLLHRSGRLSQSHMATLKDLVVARHASVVAIVQVFELMGDDFDELEDNLKLLCKYDVTKQDEDDAFSRAPASTAQPPWGASTTSNGPPKKRARPKKEDAERSNLQGQFNPTAVPGVCLTDPGWLRHLSVEFSKPYFRTLQESVEAERRSYAVYPPAESVYAAFNDTPLDQVKVVILGQDPYFNENQAHGLAFSVSKGVAVPPSLKKIYAELERSIPGFKRPTHGCLTEWAQRGVFLLNATLTVRAGQANSHAKFGWQTFTDEVIRVLNRECEGLVYLLWGEYAQKKGRLVDESRHRVLRGPHPSPLARGFEGCNHFVECNALLRQLGKSPIDWSLS